MLVPQPEIKTRLSSLRKAMSRAGIGAYIATCPEDVHYLSGFTGDDTILLITNKKQLLITDFRYMEEAQSSASLFEPSIWAKSQMGFAGSLVKSFNIKKAGYAPSSISAKSFQMMKKAARGVDFKDCDELVSGLRIIKSPWEMKKMRAALRCAETAFERLKSRIKAGMTETEVKLDLEWEMRRLGAEGVAFDTIVAAGANSSLPHAHAGKRKVLPGKPLLIDFGARKDRYNSDLTRVLFLGSIPKLWEQRYQLVREAHLAGKSVLGPGVTCRDADLAARAVFSREGCAEKFGHSLGHGVGLAVHEQPRLSKVSPVELRPGMVVTVEPGLYYPSSGGIRIEDMYLIVDNGAKRISRLDNSIESATI
ncbi:MAG: aminopeptidase P family protein [Planctomycetes bacterium]|nr:aminopeptidase P family protein [Planctomycetota bacterium]